MKNILLCVLGVGIIILTLFLWKGQNAPSVVDTVIVTDTVYVDRIIIDTVPKLVYTQVKEIKIDTLYSVDSISVPVYIPIEQKIYNNTVDSVEYTAYVSGYKSNLDSISFRYNYPVITSTITNTIKEKNRFNISPQVGIGYGIFNTKKIDVYIGFGVSYNF